MALLTESRPSTLPRTTPFGTRTYFAGTFDRVWTGAKLGLLRALKPEHDARALGSLHFAYWAIVPRKRMAQVLRANGSAQAAANCDQMLFLSDFSGDWEVYLVGFNRRLLAALDFAWGSSIGWKPRMQLADYLDFVRRHQIVKQHYFQAYGRPASVDDVRCAVHLSEELERFIAEVEDADADRFGAAFKRLRIRLGRCLAA